MKRVLPAIFAALATCGAAFAQAQAPLVDFELMTWQEVKTALQQARPLL
jgi:hypothetical protein